MATLRKEILAIALPAIVSNITTPLLAMIDVAIVGHIGSAPYIAAIALGSSMFNMLYWLFGFLRMGSSGVTAQAYGAGDLKSTSVLLYRALAVGLLVGIIIFACGRPIASVMLRFMDANPTTLPLARKYFLIAITGAPATLGTFALSGWFLGMQNSRKTMWMALLTNVVNIIASLLLVFGIGMRIEGVAIGSAIAQWSGFVFGLATAIKTYHPKFPPLSELLRLSDLRRFFTINSDIFLRTLCLVAVTVWFTRAGSMQGTGILAANALLLQLFMFFSYFMDGFAFSGEALAGKFEGKRDYAGLRSLIKSLLRIGVVLAMSFAAIYCLLGHDILSILTDDQNVLAICQEYRWWAVVVPLAGTLAFVWDGILIGLTRTRLMLISMAASAAIFFAVYFISIGGLGNHGLWLAFIVYLAARGIVEQILYNNSGRHNRQPL